jgi:CheY-like chemotaxis protein/anti-sigma regulatory factor (Ser/Thr protein kinase)
VSPTGVRARILVADDEKINRLTLRRALAARHDVIEACDGFEAVAKATTEAPDLVLMDAQMPGCDGYEATRAIKSLHSTDEFLPVVFMTAENDQERLLRGLSCGGDDFLVKPVNPLLLEGKIQALLHVRAVFETLRQQRDQLKTFRNNAQRDFTVAEAVLGNVLSPDRVALPGVEVVHRPLEQLNGDIILQAILPGGRLRVLLGDFAGHGLSAAIGAIPVAETFYEACTANRPLDRMLGEINGKLHRILPRYLFLAACALELDPTGGTLMVWNGGLPPAVIGHPGPATARRHVESGHLPLGVLAPADFDATCTSFEIGVGERVLVASDGAHETLSPTGNMFGEERLRAGLGSPEHPGASWMGALLDELVAFQGTAPPRDDVTLFGLTLGPELGAALRTQQATRPLARHRSSFEAHFDPDALRAADPLGPLRALIAASPELASSRTEIDLVVTELFSNALEHGLLNLSSDLKRDPAGFEAYYRERARALADLETGGILVSLTIDGQGPRLRAIIRVTDSGAGVDRSFREAPPDPGPACARAGGLAAGKGLHLVRSLCSEVSIRDGGRSVEASFSLAVPVHL